MLEITSQTAADYLQSAGRVARGEPIEVRELAGGVSNVVMLVTLPRRREQFVLKQARERLRVKEEWLCPVERIWHEVQSLRTCYEIIAAADAANPEAVIPEILWEDRLNFAYAMTAAPNEHKTWKELLLAGELESSQQLADVCGRLLGHLHSASWPGKELPVVLHDRTYFVQLRLDPYFKQIARVHADLAPAIGGLIDSVWNNRHTFVHGDFSPKNLLVWPGHLMLIDFEVGHFGDPAFDLGFFLSHLVLKSVWAGNRRSEYIDIANRFWLSYEATIQPIIGLDKWSALEQRAMWNLAGCMLARVDGKSPVEYLTSSQQQVVREIARGWIVSPAKAWSDAMASVLSAKS